MQCWVGLYPPHLFPYMEELNLDDTIFRTFPPSSHVDTNTVLADYRTSAVIWKHRHPYGEYWPYYYNGSHDLCRAYELRPSRLMIYWLYSCEYFHIHSTVHILFIAHQPPLQSKEIICLFYFILGDL